MSRKTKESSLERDIDKNLKRVYDRLVDRDIPERFNTLIEKLRQQENDQGPDA